MNRLLAFLLAASLALNAFLLVRPHLHQEKGDPKLEPYRSTVRDPGADASAVSRALIELGQARDPLAREVAIARYRDPNGFVRQAAADALGFFPDAESLTTLSKMSEDPEQSVRAHSIQSIAKQGNEAAEKTLKEVIARPRLPDSDRAAAYKGLQQASWSDQTRREAQEGLLKLLGSDDPSAQLLAASSYGTAGFTDPRFLTALREKLVPSENPQVRTFAILQLASARDPRFAPQLERLLKSPSPSDREAAVQALRRMCIHDRDQALRRMLAEEKVYAVWRAAANTALVIGFESEAGLIRHASSFSEEERGSMTELFAQIRKAPLAADPCAAR